MKVYLNDEPLQSSDEFTLHDLLDKAGLQTSKGIAVAVNNQVVQKSSWHQYHLNENDRIIVIGATKGG